MISPMILKQKGTTLKVAGPALQQLIDTPQPILWCNDGLYALIPIERIRNDLDVLVGRRKIIGKSISLVFYWSNDIQVSPEIGRKLEQGFQNPVKGLSMSVFPMKDEC